MTDALTAVLNLTPFEMPSLRLKNNDPIAIVFLSFDVFVYVWFLVGNFTAYKFLT